MHRFQQIVFTGALVCSVFGTTAFNAALAADTVVGVNVYDEGSISREAQDAEIKSLADSGVKTIRTGLGESSLHFITQAFHQGIGSVVIIYPFYGSTIKPNGSWARVPLSQIKTREFKACIQERLDKLESAGVHLTALELGNEINTSGYNGDIPVPGTGRVLGISDLNNPKDLEGPGIAAGYRNYLQVMQVLKDWRDHSKLNQSTPILSAGLADCGLPSAKAWNKHSAVSITDTILFLQQNGLNKLADGYGVHVYPSGDVPASQRILDLDGNILAADKKGAKPFWITEWGFSNQDQACPLDDSRRLKLIKTERCAFKSFVDQGRLAAIIWYTWTGLPGKKADPFAIFRCNDLTDAGKLAISPTLTQSSIESNAKAKSKKSSAFIYGEAKPSTEWNIFYHSPVGLLRAGKTYRIHFDYEITAQAPDCYFYTVLCRASDHDKNSGWQKWQKHPGYKGAVDFVVTPGKVNDYYLVIGIHDQGAIKVRNIQIQER